jgi:hypothetical protein
MSFLKKHFWIITVILCLGLSLYFFRKNIDVKNIISQISIVGILVYLGKLIIEKFADINIEKIKLQAQLEKEKIMLVYGNLHKDRAIVIKKLYRLLINANNALISLTKPLQMAGEKKKNEKFILVAKEYNKFLKYYEHNKIFFKNELCELIDNIIDKLRDPILDYETYLPAYEQSVEVDDRKNASDYHKELVNAWKKVKDEIPPIKEKLENEFRSLIGVGL